MVRYQSPCTQLKSPPPSSAAAWETESRTAAAAQIQRMSLSLSPGRPSKNISRRQGDFCQEHGKVRLNLFSRLPKQVASRARATPALSLTLLDESPELWQSLPVFARASAGRC